MEWPGRRRVPVQMQQLDFHGTLIAPVVLISPGCKPHPSRSVWMGVHSGHWSGAGLASVCGAEAALVSGFLQKAEHG